MLEIELAPQTLGVLAADRAAVPAESELYLKALGNLHQFDDLESIETVIRLLQRALELDPDYALAHAGLGEAYLRKNRLTREEAWLAQAEQHCNSALQLDEELAHAHMTLGLLRRATGQYERSLNDFQRACSSRMRNCGKRWMKEFRL